MIGAKQIYGLLKCHRVLMRRNEKLSRRDGPSSFIYHSRNPFQLLLRFSKIFNIFMTHISVDYSRHSLSLSISLTFLSLSFSFWVTAFFFLVVFFPPERFMRFFDYVSLGFSVSPFSLVESQLSNLWFFSHVKSWSLEVFCLGGIFNGSLSHSHIEFNIIQSTLL